jgi:Protein of unknown function (DUF1761)
MHYPLINWVAVLVAAIVIFVLGGLWYSPVLFVKPWIALQKKTEEQMRAEAASANMPLLYVGAAVTSLLIAVTLALILGHIGRDPAIAEPGGGVSAGHGAIIGFMCWLGFSASTSYATATFSGKPKQLWFIDTAYNLVCFVIAGIILAVWR